MYGTSSLRSLLVGLIIIFVSSSISSASEHLSKSSGQTVYAPVYSHVYVGAYGQEFQLAATLSVRNTNPSATIKLESVGYHDSSGKFLRNLIEAPVKISPLGSTQYFISESDTSGGFGAFFLVKWSAETKVNEPIIEVVTAGTKSGQGISFISSGKVIQ